MSLAPLVDPHLSDLVPGGTSTTPELSRVLPSESRDLAECFVAARTTLSPLVVEAYRQLELQTDRQYAALTDPRGPYRFSVVPTSIVTPYDDAEDLIDSVLSTRVLEVTTAAADRAHPVLDGTAGGAYYRFRAVHDLIGHVSTRFGFDADGEYSAWLFQRGFFQGLARWAAATELHGEISVLWSTGQVAEHKAALLDPRVLTTSRTGSSGGRYWV